MAQVNIGGQTYTVTPSGKVISPSGNPVYDRNIVAIAKAQAASPALNTRMSNLNNILGRTSAISPVIGSGINQVESGGSRALSTERGFDQPGLYAGMDEGLSSVFPAFKESKDLSAFQNLIGQISSAGVRGGGEAVDFLTDTGSALAQNIGDFFVRPIGLDQEIKNQRIVEAQPSGLGKDPKPVSEEAEIDIFDTDDSNIGIPGFTPDITPDVLVLGQPSDGSKAASKLSSDTQINVSGGASSDGATNTQSSALDSVDDLQFLGDEQRGAAGSESGSDSSRGKPQKRSNPYEDLLNESLASYNKALGLAPPKAGTIQDYKDEFSRATGIDISGDPDNKAAMVAFGTALMQNKAGKGFNVGNILSEVGAAGEKALPLMEEARKEAKAAQLAAGKYALGASKEDKAARQSYLVDQSNYLRDRKDRILEAEVARIQKIEDDDKKALETRKLEAIKHGYAVREQELKNIQDANENDKFDQIKETQLLPNIIALKIKRGFQGTKPVYADPTSDGFRVAESYKSVIEKMNMIDEMEDILTELNARGEKAAFGGQLGTILYDRMNKYSKIAGGPFDKTVFGPGGITAESELQVLIDAFVQGNKRFISQETGNGVSEGDKKDIKKVVGNIKLGESLEQNIKRLDRLRTLFGQNIGLLENELMRFGDRNEYANDEQFNKTQIQLSSILAPSAIFNQSIFDVRD